MPVWARRVEGQYTGGAQQTLVSVPADRTAILSRIDMDVSIAGAGALSVTLDGPSAGTVQLYSSITSPGPLVPREVERLVLLTGDVLRVVGTGYTVEWWVSYLLLDGAPT